MFSIFLRSSICSVTKESLNSGLGLIAVDHNTAGRSALENLAANVNWQSLEKFRAASWTAWRIQVKCNIGSNATFSFPCLLWKKISSFLPLILTSPGPMISSLLSWRDSSEHHDATRHTDFNSRSYDLMVFRAQNKKICA